MASVQDGGKQSEYPKEYKVMTTVVYESFIPWSWVLYKKLRIVSDKPFLFIDSKNSLEDGQDVEEATRGFVRNSRLYSTASPPPPGAPVTQFDMCRRASEWSSSLLALYTAWASPATPRVFFYAVGVQPLESLDRQYRQRDSDVPSLGKVKALNEDGAVILFAPWKKKNEDFEATGKPTTLGTPAGPHCTQEPLAVMCNMPCELLQQMEKYGVAISRATSLKHLELDTSTIDATRGEDERWQCSDVLFCCGPAACHQLLNFLMLITDVSPIDTLTQIDNVQLSVGNVKGTLPPVSKAPRITSRAAVSSVLPSPINLPTLLSPFPFECGTLRQPRLKTLPLGHEGKYMIQIDDWITPNIWSSIVNCLPMFHPYNYSVHFLHTHLASAPLGSVHADGWQPAKSLSAALITYPQECTVVEYNHCDKNFNASFQ